MSSERCSQGIPSTQQSSLRESHDPRLLSFGELDDIAEEAALVQPDKTRFTAETVNKLLAHIFAQEAIIRGR